MNANVSDVMPDIAQAKQFLECLAGADAEYHFQTFDDDADRENAALVRVLVGTLAQHAEELARLNAQGAGVFVTINECSGPRRTADSVVKVRALFADCDDAPAVAALDSGGIGIAPTMLIESSPGKRHAYWAATLTHDQVPVGEFKGLQKRIVARLGSDRKVCDLPRVMRLPGFWHRKAEPFMARIVSADPSLFYNFQQLEAALPPQPATGALQRVGSSDKRADPRLLASALEAIPNDRDNPEHDRDYWVKVAHAAKNAGGEALRPAFMLWSAKWGNSDEESALLWDGCRTDRGAAAAGAGTIFQLAQDAGWQRARFDGVPVGAHDEPVWPEPEPLFPEQQCAPFPLDALPDAVRGAVEEVHGFTQAPLPMVVSEAFAAMAVAAQPLVDVQRAEGLVSPAGVYVLTLAESGERKTTVAGLMQRAIAEWQSAQQKAGEKALKAYRADAAAWKQRVQGLEAALRKATEKGQPDEELREQLSRLHQQEPTPPMVPRMIYSDATTEELSYSLAHRWPNGILATSEGGIVFGGASMSEDRLLRTLGVLNTLWDGKDLPVDRRTSESYVVRGARLSASISVQPMVFQQAVTNTGGLMRGSGFSARFLVCHPASTQGSRMYREPPQGWPALTRFSERLLALLDAGIEVSTPDALGNARTTPRLRTTLQLAPEAAELWRTFYDDVERQLAPDGELAQVRDVASKAADNAARLAAILHVFGHGPEGLIGADSMRAAVEVARWYLRESLRTAGELGVAPELRTAAKLEAWLREQGRRTGEDSISTRDVLRSGGNGLRTKAALDAAMRVLEAHQRAYTVVVGQQRRICLHPELR